ncbi:hypothetical protein [Caproiciproducens faecalis]|uniref:Uncharacterized protein n=1 Tax=Caproiciproducens faecalis TaxID=2820301 RepID=A0ABS7DNF2_9FIRM|nr:hypothetical protein [Caproiciproducens faecalis]MBW7572830.1 hypothetical protein [Caproiciproducens faecalis]
MKSNRQASWNKTIFPYSLEAAFFITFTGVSIGFFPFPVCPSGNSAASGISVAERRASRGIHRGRDPSCDRKPKIPPQKTGRMIDCHKAAKKEGKIMENFMLLPMLSIIESLLKIFVYMTIIFVGFKMVQALNNYNNRK